MRASEYIILRDALHHITQPNDKNNIWFYFTHISLYFECKREFFWEIKTKYNKNIRSTKKTTEYNLEFRPKRSQTIKKETCRWYIKAGSNWHFLPSHFFYYLFCRWNDKHRNASVSLQCLIESFRALVFVVRVEGHFAACKNPIKSTVFRFQIK